MKRWELTISGYEYHPKIYAESAEKAKEVFKSETVTDVQPYNNFEYLKTIDEMISKSERLVIQNTKFNRTKEWYKYQTCDGTLRFRLYKDKSDGLYYDICEYQFMSNDSLVYPITFTYSNPQDTYNLFFTPPLSCEVVSYRLYGQPKLNKPSELKGVKQSFSVDFIRNKCKCQCFVNGDDLWIKHRDFFSPCHVPSDPKDYGTPLRYRLKKYFGVDKAYLDKFVYPDSWGEIILRNEAWIVFRNIRQVAKRDSHIPVSTVVKSFVGSDVLIKNGIHSLDGCWHRFFETVCNKYTEYISNNKTEEV